MNPHLPPLIRALLAPARYAPGVQRVELVQTHISWVLLAGEFAYKIKKPVTLPFLDFSTLAQRLHYCQEELRLNQRFAPDLYLDVVGIFNTPQDPHWHGDGIPIEYAVRMRRFDESGRLDRLCARGELQARHLSDLVTSLTAFHDGAAVAPPDGRFGSTTSIMAPARDNFEHLMQLLPSAAVHTRLAALRAWTEAQFSQLAGMMLARQRAGYVRECHGDLHLANMVLINGHVQMFDAIEFSDELRWIDVASEFAFTYVDLLAHHQPGLANWFLNEALSQRGDYEAAPLLRFYAVYRSLVNAKVAAIRASQGHGDERKALHHLALAEQLLQPATQRLVITHGLSGCGKTSAAHALLQDKRLGATLCLHSDVERKRLHGLARTASSGSALQQGIYTDAAHVQTYARLHALAQGLLQAGWSVIVDGAFLQQEDRDHFRDLAHGAGVAFSILAPQASPDQLRQRILARQARGGDASEATLAVLAHQMTSLQPLTPAEPVWPATHSP